MAHEGHSESVLRRPWAMGAMAAFGAIGLVIASPFGMVGSTALGFLIPSGWPAPAPGIGMVLLPVWFMGAFVLPAYLLGFAIYGRRVELAAAALGVILLMWATFEPARQFVRLSIHRGLSTVARSEAPLISAIERYRVDYGEYPERIDDLIPKYLRRVPSTGLAAYPKLEYYRSKGEEPPRGYSLTVPISLGVLDFSAFQYWPEGDYPRTWPHLSPEIVGKWAIWYD